MKKLPVLILVTIMIIGLTLSITACKEIKPAPVYSNAPTQFESREQVKEIIDEYNAYYSTGDGILDDVFGILTSCVGCGSYKSSDGSDNEVAMESNGSGAVRSYSSKANYSSAPEGAEEMTEESDYTKTNVQVDELDEGDIVKTDGRRIYYLTQGGLVILEVDGKGGSAIVYSETYENFIPQELYILGNRIAVIGHQYEEVDVCGNSGTMGYSDCCYVYGMGTSRTSVRVYDVSDASAPVLERSVCIDGYLNTTRLTNGYLYMLSDYSFYYGAEENYIPYITDSANGGEKKELEISNMYYFEGIECYGYSILSKINLNDTSDFVYKAYLGAGSNVYVSTSSIYLSATDYASQYTYDEETGYYSYNYNVHENSRIAKFSMQTLEFVAAGSVEGTINDRYSMDEYDGNLRVASSVLFGDENYSNITVLNGNMEEIGKATGIAKGEKIYSARFSGTVGNIVTFRQIDPLFKIDLSDPTNPIVSEGLKKTGVSYYLQYLDGTDLLIGIGYGTDAENAVTTNNMVEVALFDNSGTESKLINRLYIGTKNGYAYTDATYNAHAIVYDKDRDIFAFPVTVEEYSGNYYCPVCSMYVFGFSTGELKLKAVLSNITESDVNNANAGGDYYTCISRKAIERGVRIGDYFYTISNMKVVGYSLTDFSKVSEVIITSVTYDEDGYADIIIIGPGIIPDTAQ